MKRIHAIVTLMALALIMSSFSSLVSAQTVWRDGEQFKVVNSNQVVLFNISNVSISVPNDAKDINVTIHARFRLLRAPDIVNVRAFVCEGNSNNVVFTLSSSGSKRVILKAHMEPNQISSWNVTFCPEDICSNTLDVNLTLVNVSPIDGAVKISNAYVVLSNFSIPIKALIPVSNKVLIIAKYRDANTGKMLNTTTTATSFSQPKPNFLRLGIIMTWILLLILIPTIAFLFSGGDRRERGRVAMWSLLGNLVIGTIVGIIGNLWKKEEKREKSVTWNLIRIGITIIIVETVVILINLGHIFWLFCLFIITLIATNKEHILNKWNNLNMNTRASLISAFVTLLVILNVYFLLQNQVHPSDFFLLLWVFFNIFGVGLTFVLIGGGENGAVFTFGYLFFLIFLLVISIPYPIYGLALIALLGYAIVFVQSSIKVDIKRRLLSGQKETLETFYNLIFGAFILPSALVFAYAFTKGTGLFSVISSSQLSTVTVKILTYTIHIDINTVKNELLYLSLLYLGLTLNSILLLWADDLTRPQDRRRLTLQNAIAMLLIVLGIGSVSILELNNQGRLGWVMFFLEAVPGALLLALLNRRN